MRALIMIVFFALAAAGVIFAVRDNMAAGLVASPVVALGATSTTAATLTGTIDYQQNNAGAPVPYLVYRSDGVRTKALVFTSASTCTTSAGSYPCQLISDALETYYGGASVTASGTIQQENLLVSELEPA